MRQVKHWDRPEMAHPPSSSVELFVRMSAERERYRLYMRDGHHAREHLCRVDVALVCTCDRY